MGGVELYRRNVIVPPLIVQQHRGACVPLFKTSAQTTNGVPVAGWQAAGRPVIVIELLLDVPLIAAIAVSVTVLPVRS